MSSPPPVLALDISGSRALLARFEPHPTVRLEVPNLDGQAARYWPNVLCAALELAREGEPLGGIGISFGGPVGLDGRPVSIHVAGWHDLDPAAELRAALGLPTVIENDANCGAVGEFRHGRWGRPRSLVFLTCSTGIGGGIVDSRGLLKGARGLAGEVGHICVDPHGRSCPCGSRGCLEAMCSGTAIRERAEAALVADRGRSALEAKLSGGRLPGAKEVFDAAASGDVVAQRVLDEVFADYGRGIANIHNAFDPEQIVIGGGVSLAGDALVKPVAAAARPWLMADRREHLRLGVASLGLDAQLYGAASLAWDEVR